MPMMGKFVSVGATGLLAARAFAAGAAVDFFRAAFCRVVMPGGYRRSVVVAMPGRGRESKRSRLINSQRHSCRSTAWCRLQTAVCASCVISACV